MYQTPSNLRVGIETISCNVKNGTLDSELEFPLNAQFQEKEMKRKLVSCVRAWSNLLGVPVGVTISPHSSSSSLQFHMLLRL